MKKTISIMLCMLMLLSCVNVSAENFITVELNANKIEFDTQPVNINGRVLVPARTIFEAIGATVLWDAPTRTVTSKHNGRTVIVTIDSKTMLVNGEKITLDVPPMIISDRTLVPARAVSEAFNADVIWDAHNNTVRIFTKSYLSRIESIKTHTSSKELKENIKSDFSISYFEEYDVKINANDGTDFEIISESKDHFSLLSVRADVYVGPEHPMTDAYAKAVAEGMVKAVSGTLISTEISHIGEEPFIKIHYTNPSIVSKNPNAPAKVLVYMGIESGVVYTMTYTYHGDIPKNISADINYMMDTLIIH